ncbi:MAG: trigger factor [Lewinellaceae bacterium]|nr:trigger factor [Lewinellaceae bacterium]
MPKVVREDIDNLNSVLTVTIEKDDYASRFDSELSKYRKQAHMKGFRKGKTPASVLKKMYGRGVLADVINDLLQKELYDYLSKEDIKILGQPLPSDSQAPIDFDVRELQEYVFKFDLGLAPEFEVQGIDKSSTYRKLQVEITDEMVEEDLKAARQRHGERLLVEEDIQENDILKLSARELENGQPKEGGVESEFSLLVRSIANEPARKELLSKKKGDTLSLDLFELESDKDEKYIRRYFLNLDEDDQREVGREYEVAINEVSRIEPAELNQEFFDKYFGPGQVSNEEEARAKVREYMEKHYGAQAEGLLYRDIQEGLMEKNALELPEAFLKRWMKAANENVSDEIIEREFPEFVKNLQWSLIRSKLARQFDIKVEKEELLENFKDRVRNYFGGGGMGNMPDMEGLITNTAQRLMEDEKQREQAFEEILADKLYHAIVEVVSVEPDQLPLEAFEAEVAKAREAVQAKQAALSGGEEEE